jgi:hypothetical protein
VAFEFAGSVKRMPAVREPKNVREKAVAPVRVYEGAWCRERWLPGGADSTGTRQG